VQQCAPLRQKFLVIEPDTTLWYEQHKASKRNKLAEKYKQGIHNELVSMKEAIKAKDTNRQSESDTGNGGEQTDNV
jgi:hypothetical protein